MTLIVEDGTGLTNANSYISVAGADAYVAERIIGSTKTTWDAASTSSKESALIRATDYLDENYRSRWKGYRGSQDQALDWPRYSVVDGDGYLVASDAVPGQLSSALVEIAVTVVADTESMTPEATTAGSVRRERIRAGSVESETEYSSPEPTILSAAQRYPKVHRMLGDLIDQGNVLPLG